MHSIRAENLQTGEIQVTVNAWITPDQAQAQKLIDSFTDIVTRAVQDEEN